jgi:hypothetical protein
VADAQVVAHGRSPAGAAQSQFSAFDPSALLFVKPAQQRGAQGVRCAAHGVPLPADPSINTVTTVFTETATNDTKNVVINRQPWDQPDEVHGFIGSH